MFARAFLRYLLTPTLYLFQPNSMLFSEALYHMTLRAAETDSVVTML